MKKSGALSVSASLIVLLIVSAWLVNNQFSSLQTQVTALEGQNSELQNQNNDLKNQTVALSDQNRQLQDRVSQLLEQLRICYNASVRIIDSEFVSGFNPFVGLTLINRVNVTVQNFGSNDVSGLTVTVELVYNGTELWGSEGFTKQVDVLRAGERLEISDWVYSGLSSRNIGTVCVSTLMKGNAILDLRTDAIVWD
jgi:uncharacterized protein YlxW (UPF0749 family)